MKSTIISFMRKAVNTLRTPQWDIDDAHLQTCIAFFNRFEEFLENESGRFEEEVEEDEPDWDITITYKPYDGYRESVRFYVQDPYDDASVMIFHRVRAFHRDMGRVVTDKDEKFTWDLNFDDNKELYYVGVRKGDEIRDLWGYKFGKRFR